MKLPNGALGQAIFKAVVDSYDEETAKKDPDFYSKAHTELRAAALAASEGKQLTLSKPAQEKLVYTVREVTDDTDIPAVREQGRKWLREHRG